MPENVLRVAVIGDFQIGKSSLVNCLLAESRAKTGEGYFPTTNAAAEYPFAPGVVLVDTPGYDDANLEHAKISDEEIQKADVLIFVKTEKTLGKNDKAVLHKGEGKPMIVLFNCTHKTHDTFGCIPSLPENLETCEAICTELANDGMVGACLSVAGCLVTPLNILWTLLGLGLPISDEQENDTIQFARQNLGLNLQDKALRDEMLRRSGFIPVRNFLRNLPLELLKHAVANPEREIDRIVGRFAEKFEKRWNAA